MLYFCAVKSNLLLFKYHHTLKCLFSLEVQKRKKKLFLCQNVYNNKLMLKIPKVTFNLCDCLMSALSKHWLWRICVWRCEFVDVALLALIPSAFPTPPPRELPTHLGWKWFLTGATKMAKAGGKRLQRNSNIDKWLSAAVLVLILCYHRIREIN